MSSDGAQEAIKGIPESFRTFYPPIYYLKIGCLGAIVLYIIGFKFYSSKKSYWDAIAARNVVRILRWLILIETMLLLPLFYCVIALGQPMQLNAVWKLSAIGYHQSWIYDWGRPFASFILIGFGTFADMHIFMRACVMLGSIHELICCNVAAYQVYDYYMQVLTLGAPTAGFTRQILYAYFLRDVVSGSVSMLILLFGIHLTFILGWGRYQLIQYGVIAGGDFDRCEVMRRQRTIKKACELHHEMKEFKRMKDQQAIENSQDHTINGDIA